MLGLKEASPLDMLRQFSVYFDAEFSEELGAAKMSIDNKNGTGYIALFEPFSGLTAWIYNINFTNELHIDMSFSESGAYYFGFNLVGSQLHKLPDDIEYIEIQQNQNFILVSQPGGSAEFVVPKNVDYKCCYLIVEPEKLSNLNVQSRLRLKEDLLIALDDKMADGLTRHFGNIDSRTATYARILIENQRTDLVGRLLSEGSLLNMLASQIEAHDQAGREEKFQPLLSKEELSRVTELGDLIRKDVSKKPSIMRLAKTLRMSPKKLQLGTRFLYGCTANKYISNIRLEHARELFHLTDMTVSEICYSAGYSSRSYFSKLFQERYGMLPIEYKQSFIKKDLVFEISYRSLASSEFLPSQLTEIIKTSEKSNANFKVTGSLIFHRNVFFQIIEGPKKEVLKLFQNIINDSRHQDVRTMWRGHKPQRDFKEWSMALISDVEELEPIIQGNLKGINIGHLLGDLNKKSLASENLWRKVRNILKVSNTHTN